MRLLVEAYIFADRRDSEDFHNAIIDEIGLYLPGQVGDELLDVLSLIFTENPETSKLRRLVIDRFAWEYQLETLKTLRRLLGESPPSFVLAICDAILGRIPQVEVPECEYYGAGHRAARQGKGCHYDPGRFLHAGNSAFLGDAAVIPHKTFCATYHVHKEGKSYG